MEYSQSLESGYTSAQVVDGPPDPNSPQVPVKVAIVPFSDPLYIKVGAMPSLQVTIVSATLQGNKEIPSPTTGSYWAGTAFFKYLGKGKWGAEKPQSNNPNTDPDTDAEDRAAVNFSPPYSLVSESPTHTVTTFINFFVSQVRLATRRCMQSASANPWQVQQQPNAQFMAQPAVANGLLNWAAQQSLDLNSGDEVIEFKDFDCPKLVSVHWPRENDPTALFPLRAPEAQFLIFFHASYQQNAAVYQRDQGNPFGFEHVFHGFQTYTQLGDYARDSWPLSIPYSIKMAAKKTVMILPMNRLTSPELAELNNGDQFQCMIEEIQCMMLRAKAVSPRAGSTNLFGLYFFDPNIGRIGCGSFSAGHNEMLRFKMSADRHAYLKNAVQEYFLFDPIHDNGSFVGQEALGLKPWATQNSNRTIRVYNNESSDSHALFLGVSTSPPTPYVEDAHNNQLTAGVITDLEMKHARNRLLGLPSNQEVWPGGKDVWGSYHSNFVRTFLVDALRKSGFR